MVSLLKNLSENGHLSQTELAICFQGSSRPLNFAFWILLAKKGICRAGAASDGSSEVFPIAPPCKRGNGKTGAALAPLKFYEIRD